MNGLSRDDVIRMAQEAGITNELIVSGWGEHWIDMPVQLERFAALVAAAEREACAKVCEQPVDEIQITDDCSEYKYRDNQECADAIRARGSDAA